MSLDTMDKIYREGLSWGFVFGVIVGVIVLLVTLYFCGVRLVMP